MKQFSCYGNGCHSYAISNLGNIICVNQGECCYHSHIITMIILSIRSIMLFNHFYNVNNS